MISFPFPVSDDIEAILTAQPAAVAVTPMLSAVVTDESVLHLKCAQLVIKEFKWNRSYERTPFVLPLSQVARPGCKPRFVLVLNLVSRSGSRYVRKKKLHYEIREDHVFVATNSVAVEEWLKNGRSTVSRFSRRTARSSTSRPLRPNPEQTIGQVRHFRQLGATVSWNTTVPYLASYRTWSGTRTPGFGKLKRRFLPVNDHSVDLQVNQDGGFLSVFVDTVSPDASQIYLTGWQAAAGGATNMPPDLEHNSSLTAVAHERLVERMSQKLDANLAQDMAQFGQLSSMMNSTVKRLTGAITSLRRKDPAGAIKSLWEGSGRNPRYRKAKEPSFSGSLANNWLELQYGWKPLLMDIEGSMRSLSLFYQQAEHVVRSVSASASKEVITTGIIYDDSVHTVPVGRWENHHHGRYRVKLRYKVDSRLKAFLAQTGFNNPVNLVWEVLPYSFVIDWFLPIGNYLQSLSNFDGLEFVDGVETRFSRQLFSGVISRSGTRAPYQSWQIVHDYGSYDRERVKLDRSKLTSFPRPDLPRFKNPISTVHVLNGLALLRGAFGR